MEDPSVTVLLSTFASLGLPRTLALRVDRSASIQATLEAIDARLPFVDEALVVTTTSNKQLYYGSKDAVSTLLSTPHDAFIPLRLSARVCGGKGGFGSQLRAAGGRMSSRKKRNQNNEPQNGSNRNLDGRRLRTVDAAKKLADYLAKKPEMDEKEREEQRKKWETTVELATKREEEIKMGKMGSGQGRLDAEYVESKELAEERTREAVLKAMRAGGLGNERTGSESSMEVDGEESEDEKEGSSDSSEAVETESKPNGGRVFFGWGDEDDDEEESDEKEDTDVAQSHEPAYGGKGKARAT